LILSDGDIIKNIELGNIVCTPLDRANISNSSIDLRLGQYIAKQPRRWFDWFRPIKFETDGSGRLTVLNPIKPKIYNLLDHKIRDSHKFILKPGEFVLAETLELVGSRSRSIECRIADKSTNARLGLSVCFSSGKVEPGNVLKVTLELKNNGHNPIELQYGMHCCQIQFEQLTSPVTRMYNGKYLNSLRVETAK
jgi:deoxycytidine triphosphate deaminase